MDYTRHAFIFELIRYMSCLNSKSILYFHQDTTNDLIEELVYSVIYRNHVRMF